jgi:hypothetical protein
MYKKMNILIIIISLSLGIFAKPTFAFEINIKNVNDAKDIIIGTTFPVIFEVVNGEVGVSYNFKFCGGIGDSNTSIQIYNSEKDKYINCIDDGSSYSSLWEDSPSFVINIDIATTINGIARIPEGKDYCQDPLNPSCYLINTRILKIGSSDFSTSNLPYPIRVIAPTPTLTPTLTPTQTSSRQVPTLTPTPTVNMSIFGTSTDSASLITPESIQSSDLISQDPNLPIIETGSNPIEIEESQAPKKSNLIPLILLGSGIIFLIISLIFLKINKK